MRKVQRFNGVDFYEGPGGYYRASTKQPHSGSVLMHREVWAAEYGPIPPKHEVHHVDGNKANNALSNLELMHQSKHRSMHGKEWTGTEKAKQHMDAIRPKATEWHKSDEGRQWHREHAKRIAENAPILSNRCTWCSKLYEAKKGAVKKGFCSMSCQGMARKASGVDDINRDCAVCGATFRVNKYVKTKTCSKECASVAMVAKRNERRTLKNG